MKEGHAENKELKVLKVHEEKLDFKVLREGLVNEASLVRLEVKVLKAKEEKLDHKALKDREEKLDSVANQENLEQ